MTSDRNAPAAAAAVRSSPSRLTPARRRILISLAMSLATAMSSIETTVVASVLPTVTRDLGDTHLYRWIVAAYMLASAVVMPICGRMADAYGRRPVFFTSLFLFLVGSAASGAAPTMLALIAFRVIQGFGAGGLLVLAMTILGDIYSPAERARVQGALSALGTAAGAAGPLIGALILHAASWRWAFYVNVPIGLLAWGLTRSTYVDSHEPQRHRFDIVGALLLSAGIVGLLLSVGETVSILGLIVSLGILGLFTLHEYRVSEPLLSLELLRRPAISLSCWADVVRCATAFAIMTYLPLYVTVKSGGSAINAGLILTPIILGAFIGSSASGWVAHHISLRKLSLIAFWVYSIASILMAAVIYWIGTGLALNIVLFVTGAASATSYLALTLMVQVSVTRPELGTATGVLTLARYLGGALGVGLLGVLLVSHGKAGAELSAVAHPALLKPFYHFFVANAAVTVVAALITLGLPGHLRLDGPGDSSPSFSGH